MSIEAHVFTPESQPIAIVELAKDMAAVRLFTRVLRDFRDWSRFEVIESGHLQDGDIACAWLTSETTAPEIGAAVTHRDHQSIESFLCEGNLGACGVVISDVTRVPTEERVSLAEVEGDEHFANSMSNAKVAYNACTAAGRNDLSIVLQFRLTQVIAKQRGGVWTDPANGDYLIVSKGRWERLPCLVAFEEQNS